MDLVFGNRYRVEEQVGSGGMATVYRGIDAVLKRPVAVKVLHPHLASRDDARRRFNREAQAIARLHHQNIVDVYDYSGDHDDQSYLVTEFVHGRTLTEFCLAHGPFLPQSAALIAHAIAGALRHAHGQGIIHRDIKPDNLMIAKSGVIKLMDFGIATAVDLEQMTATGAILGSPAHMAPEQIDGAEIDNRVDVFAFGTLLYYLVTQKLPFMASNPHALFRKILECRYDPPSRHNPAIGRRFEEIVATCLAREPEDRFSGMAAVEDALAAYLRDHQMNDNAQLLSRLLKAPEQFQLEWKPALVQVLCEEGREQARVGSLALAIDAYNRALAIDPNATEPRKGLSDLTSRSRRKRRFRTAGMAAVIAVIVVLVGVGVGKLLEPGEVPKLVPEPATAFNVPAFADPTADRVKADPPKVQLRPAPRAEPIAHSKPSGVQPAGSAQGGPPANPAETAPKEPIDTAAVKPVPAAPANAVRTRRTKRARKKPPTPRSAGPAVEPPPAPETGTLVTVILGSLPPSAHLFLNGQRIGVGSKKKTLIMGTKHVLRCKPNRAQCPQCPDYLERKVEVKPLPGGGTPSFKCDFRDWARTKQLPGL